MRAWIRWATIAGAASTAASSACSTPFPCAELGGELDYDGTCFYPEEDAGTASSSSGGMVIDSGPAPVDAESQLDAASFDASPDAQADAEPGDASPLTDASDRDASDAEL